jgi:hypothetical protein
MVDISREDIKQAKEWATLIAGNKWLGWVVGLIIAGILAYLLFGSKGKVHELSQETINLELRGDTLRKVIAQQAIKIDSLEKVTFNNGLLIRDAYQTVRDEIDEQYSQDISAIDTMSADQLIRRLSDYLKNSRR